MRTRRWLSRAGVTAGATAASLAVFLGGAGGAQAATTTSTLGYTATDTGAVPQIAALVGARAQWLAGNTGQGVDVAVIDTGIAPVTGLGTNVVNGPDLSFDSQNPSTRYTDRYGHGTHMASIIAGRDGDGSAASALRAGTFSGIAPGSRILDVKVGASDGTVDVTQVIAAITWITQHAHDNGLNIRVINLSYGTNATQTWAVDPLAYAAQVAWQAGILVVAAGGNDATTRSGLADPAVNPYLLAVGAEDPMGTSSVADDVIPDFSQRGTATRHVDLVAPGMHVIGLRVPGGAVDTAFPSSRVGTRFTRGSGTSQASAVVSGAAALLFAARPGLTPDQAKWLLTSTATALPLASTQTAGAGLVDVDRAVRTQTVPAATLLTLGRIYGVGTGSVEGSRGTTHVSLGGVPLAGEQDIFSVAWRPATYAATTVTGTSWNGSQYLGSNWTGTRFAGGGWASVTWTGQDWTGRSWVSEDWSGRSWVDNSWSGSGWKSGPWSSASWS